MFRKPGELPRKVRTVSPQISCPAHRLYDGGRGDRVRQSLPTRGIIECGCNMHARRFVVKAFDGGNARAAIVIAAYQVLYPRF